MHQAVTEDKALLQLLTEDPEAGIRALQSRYGGMIFRIAVRVLPEYPQDVEEVASDVLAAAWRQAGVLLESGRPLGPWLTVTARNRAIDRRRFLTRRQSVPLDEDLDLLLAADSSEGEDLIAALVTAMEQPDREIFLRRYYRMETAQEIGAAMGIQPHTVNVRLARGRARLKREYLKQMGKEQEYDAKQHGIPRTAGCTGKTG